MQFEMSLNDHGPCISLSSEDVDCRITSMLVNTDIETGRPKSKPTEYYFVNESGKRRPIEPYRIPLMVKFRRVDVALYLT